MRMLSGVVVGGMLLMPGVAVWAQGTTHGEDPANLKGERVRAVEAEPLDVDRGAKGVAGMLKKLATRASLLMIVAHPDDEDGGMLTYESRGVGARVGMLTLTRGEGGQNVMSGDFNDALGLVRTRELLAADRYLGVDQMFGTEVDFGFSKTKEEAFSQWTHQRVLYDAVRAVRLYRPLVVTSVFLGAPTDGHGQHQVSGEIAQEVFNAAADPKVFPEMGLPVWAPAKVFGRMPFAQVGAEGMFDYATGKTVPVRFENYVTGKVSNEAPRPTVTVPEGEASSLLGGSYVQFARRGLALQKTQIGAGVRLAPAGRFDVGYTRYGSRVTAKDREDGFFDGVDVSLAGIADLAPSLRSEEASAMREGLARLQGEVTAATTAFRMEHPETVAPGLRDALRELDGLIGSVSAAKAIPARERYDVLHELRVKRVQANEALVQALGLTLQAEVEEPATGPVLAGQTIRVKVRVEGATRSPLAVKSRGWKVYPAMADGEGMAGGGDVTVVRGRRLEQRMRFTFPDTTAPTKPYFLRTSLEQPVYQISEAALRNAPTTPAALAVRMTLLDGDVPVEMERVVGGQVGEGEMAVYQPLVVVPAVSVGIEPAAAIVPLTERSFALSAQVMTGGTTIADGSLQMKTPEGWAVTPKVVTLRSAVEAKNGLTQFAVRPGSVGERTYVLRADAVSGGRSFTEGYRQVGYPGVVRDNLYAAAAARVRGVDVKVPAGLKVAYLPGTGDSVEMSFGQIGIASTRVSVAEIAAGKLAGPGGVPAYDALVMGVRAYAAHKDLAGVTAQVTAFARAGGVVVVQYNLAEFGGPDAPYPLALGTAEKVVEERAAVRLLEPKSQVLSWPNRITEHDFDGWVEERGHGFMGEWDPKYAAVTEVHDAGQDPQRGGLLVASVGKGAYVYCAYALYRQLPEGVPGAFRLLANMVSLGRRP